ncbi:MAG TPA: nuclear transport factor 2 family protein, partial [Microthrixaceae bacterium]|nr:nuclear transport factor 2 family protein [Microthrixaceae bacterium]
MAGPNDMTTYPEDELRRFYARHRALHEAGDWQGLGDLFTDDASYLDSVYGWSHGLPAIRSFLERSMTGLEDWSFPISAVAYDADAGVILKEVVGTSALPADRIEPNRERLFRRALGQFRKVKMKRHGRTRKHLVRKVEDLKRSSIADDGTPSGGLQQELRLGDSMVG